MSKNNLSQALIIGSLLLTPVVLSSCTTIRFTGDVITVLSGVSEIRDVLVSNVKHTGKAQKNVKKQFESSLDKFIEITNSSKNPTNVKYKKVEAEYDKCQRAANDLSSNIGQVEHWGEELFKEWNKELSDFNDPKLAADSQRMLNNSYAKFQRVLTQMKRAEHEMNSVLVVFGDKVLFLKHASATEAIVTLEKREILAIEGNINNLIIEMEAAISEADRFIQSLPDFH